MPRVLIGSIAEMRVSISRAALLVKVTARTPFGLTFPVWISQAMRVVRTRVFPEPAPARISADWSGRVTAASCSGLRFSSRLSMRAFANARFYRTLRERRSPLPIRVWKLVLRDPCSTLRSGLVVVRPEAGLPFQAACHEFGVPLRFEVRKPHAVDALVIDFRRNDLGRISGSAQIPVKIECPLGRDCRAGRDFPFAAPRRHALALLGFGLPRPFPQLVRHDCRDRLRQPRFEDVEGQPLIHGERGVAGPGDLDLALDQADDLAVRRRLAPQVGAAYACSHGLDADAHLALAAESREQLGGEAERPFGHFHRRRENLVLAHLHPAEEERAFLAQFHRASVDGPEKQPRARAGLYLVVVLELHARRERMARSAALH